MPIAPWEKWNLDADFLTTLGHWAVQNPETSLDRVLKRICDAIDQGKEFFELIPDGGFPARGLVKGLAHLVKLGKTISIANQEIYGFAMEVVQWVSVVQQAFSQGQRKWFGKHFTQTTWQNLQHMRDIIDEICQWAAARLLDKRWSLSGVWEKLQATTAIQEFKVRIAEARAMFNEAAIINQSRGIDVILDYIGIMTKQQKKILQMLISIKAVQQNALNSIVMRLDEEAAERHKIDIVKERREFVERMLSKHAIEDPSHYAQDKRPCDEGTREGVLTAIQHWVKDLSETSQNFLWLSGNPGCGKSAIAASFAEASRAEDILWSEFFINRNNPVTTNPSAYFPTIARQLAERSREVEEMIHGQLKSNASLRASMSPTQAAELFLAAIGVASKHNPGRPVVIIIDGLDETDRSHLSSTAIIFAQLFDALLDFPNAKVFISSRPEDEIQNPFARSMLGNPRVSHLHLDTSASFEDVAKYMRKELAKIVLEKSLDWEVWPGEEGMKTLAKHASGLFIWAVTAVKFFRQQIDDSGEEDLQHLLTDLNSKGLMDINALYGYIVFKMYEKRTKDDPDTAWAFERFRRLIGAIVVLCEPLSLDNLRKIMDLRKSPSSPPVDIIQFVKRLRTVLVVGVDAVHGQTVPRLHKSFVEYITGNHVDKQFRVDINASHREIGVRCLHQLPLIPLATTSFKIPTVFRYASRFWLQHLSQALPHLVSGIMMVDPSQNLCDVGGLLQRRPSKQSLAPVSLIMSRSSVVVSIMGQSCAWNINHGIVDGGVSCSEIRTAPLPQSSEPQLLHNSPPPTTPVSVGFFPDNKDIIWVLPCATGLWNTETGTVTQLMSFHGAEWSSSAGTTVEDGCFAGETDGVFRIWNVRGSRISILKSIDLSKETEKWNNNVTCFALSPKGQTLVVGFDDGHIRFWSVASGARIVASSASATGLKKPILHTGKPSPVTYVTWSADGARVLSCSKARTEIYLWALIDGKFHLVSVLKGRTGNSVPRSLAFSPEGTTASSGHDNGMISIWHSKSGDMLGSSISTCRECSISFIRYSHDGENIISITTRGHIDVWDVETREHITSFFRENQFPLDSACFRPKFNQLCVASIHELKLLELRGNYPPMAHSKDPDINDVAFASFSSSGIRTCSISSNNQVCIWAAVDGKWERILLEKTTGLVHPQNFVFSPNETEVAALSSSGIVYIWNAKSGRLIASSRIRLAMSAFSFRNVQDTTLFFTPDNRLITISQGTASSWETSTGGKLIRTPSPPLLPNNPSPFFDDDDYYLDHAATYNDMRWIPSKKVDAGIWVFIGDYVIRVQNDGTLIITRVANLNAKFIH